MSVVPVVISAAVEGSVDEAVARRLVRHVGDQPGAVYGKVHPAGLSRCIGFDVKSGRPQQPRAMPFPVPMALTGEATDGGQGNRQTNRYPRGDAGVFRNQGSRSYPDRVSGGRGPGSTISWTITLRCRGARQSKCSNGPRRWSGESFGVILRRVDGGLEILPSRSSGGRCLSTHLFGQPTFTRQFVNQILLFAGGRQRERGSRKPPCC